MNGRSHYTVGDFLQQAKTETLTRVALLLGLLVYVAMLAWSGVHNYNLLAAGAPPNLRFWGFLGFLVLEINAVALPLALHYWTHASAHRFAALMFYILDLALLFLNTVLDYSIVAGTGLLERAPWLQGYRDFILPTAPIIAGTTWPVLWFLNPKHRQRQMLAELEASTQEVLTYRVAEAAQSVEVDELVQRAARELALRVVRQTLALPVDHVHYSNPEAAESTQVPGTSPNGHREIQGNPTMPPRMGGK